MKEMYYRPGGVVIWVMTDDDSVITRTPSKDATVTDVMLNVTNNSTFRDRSNRQDVSNHKSGLLAAVYKLPSVHTLSRNEQLLLFHVSKWVAESDSGEWGTTTRIVDNFSDNSLEIPIALTKIKAPELGRPLAVVGVRLEDRTGTLTLSADDSTHSSLEKEGQAAVL